MLLDYKNKFATKKVVPVAPDGTHVKINDNGFRKWSNVNMYRTSYNDMSNTVRIFRRFNNLSFNFISHQYGSCSDCLKKISIYRELLLQTRTSTFQVIKATFQVISQRMII